LNTAFFDTSVLLHALHNADPQKHALARALVNDHVANCCLVLSTQVLQELYTALARQQRLARADALEVVRILAQETVVGASAEQTLRALELAAFEGLSPADAAIVQAALDAGCATLWSEELPAQARYGRMQVLNPFIAAPAASQAATAAAAKARPNVRPLRGSR
jgi:predicted nucleic acid-binding protein